MSVDVETIRRVARLARLRVPEGELEGLTGEINGILAWIDQLEEVDVEGVEPMTSAVETTLPLREDAITDGGKRDDVLANAPCAEEGFFVVPKVVE